MSIKHGFAFTDFFRSLLRIDNAGLGLDATLRSVIDQDGTVLPIKVSTTGIEFTGTVARSAQVRIINTEGKVGATAGWTLGGGTVDTGLMATMPASQTAGTLVVPIPGLKVGDTITAFHLIGQIESAGGAVTLDADLRKMTAAAADVTDASVGDITQISVTADTAITSANSAVSGLAEVVAADETFYVLLTGTTAGTTDIALQGIAITVTEA